jgi:hypothetical protein
MVCGYATQPECQSETGRGRGGLRQSSRALPQFRLRGYELDPSIAALGYIARNGPGGVET